MKNLFLSLLAASLLVAFSPLGKAIKDESLVLYFSFYINGEPADATNPLPTTKACDDACPFRVGDDGKGNLGAGAIDELAVFKRALTEEEIKTLMEKGGKAFMAVKPVGKLTTTLGSLKNKF